MKLSRKRTGVAVIIATLIMVAAAALFTSIMLFWGLSFQGQSLQNFGNAISRSNNAAAEQVSIDGVLFSSIQNSPTATYSATVYVRNFGDNPLKIAGIHVRNLQTGSSPASLDCEVTTSTSSVSHFVIVARSMGAVNIDTATGSVSTSNPGCTASGGAITLPAAWDGQTISVQVNSEAGTRFARNFIVPSAQVSPSAVTFSGAGTSTPSILITLANVGSGYSNLASVTVTGSSSNGVGHFTGTITVTIPGSGTASLAAPDGSWSVSPTAASSYQAVASGTSNTMTISATSTGTTTALQHGDLITISATTAEGTTTSASFSA